MTCCTAGRGSGKWQWHDAITKNPHRDSPLGRYYLSLFPPRCLRLLSFSLPHTHTHTISCGFSSTDAAAAERSSTRTRFPKPVLTPVKSLWGTRKSIWTRSLIVWSQVRGTLSRSQSLFPAYDSIKRGPTVVLMGTDSRVFHDRTERRAMSFL